MKKNVSKLLLSAFTMLIVLSLISSINVTAVETPHQTIEVQGDTIQTQLQSNLRTMFCFRERTRLTVCANIGLELDINCQGLSIGDKDVIIEVEGNGDLRMTITCTREEAQLGLMNGSVHRMRNRNTYRHLEGLCIAMECTPNYYCQCKCDPECVCDPQCKCDSECICDPQCKCDAECVCDPQCKCDTECVCDPQCKCDSECVCDPQCKCDAEYVCDPQCKCDAECVCDPQCKCEAECVCDPQCKCDAECVCDPQCKCDAECVCDPLCKCDPECNCNSECPNNGAFLKARLRIKATNQNQFGQWACYDYENEEWVIAPTINQDGYLTVETNVLSTWTLLIPEESASAVVSTVAIASVSALGILAISVFYIKKRR